MKTLPKLYIGPMSYNVVTAALEFSRDEKKVVGFIPSRRQVDYNSGYVNNWTTKAFAEFIRNYDLPTILCRDHGGPAQGAVMDDGLHSFKEDSRNFDIIHIDPWKQFPSYQDGLNKTIECMLHIDSLNKNVKYEVGTEEAIRKFSTQELKTLLGDLRNGVGERIYNKILYCVVQSGVALNLGEQKNTGKYDSKRLSEMVDVCKNFGVLSKEHNGDYLSSEQIRDRFKVGLDAINIAPEFGQIETMCYLDELGPIDEYYNLCLESGHWRKWTSPEFEPDNNREKLIKICGHYILSDPSFTKLVPDLDKKIKFNIKDRIKKLYEGIEQ